MKKLRSQEGGALWDTVAELGTYVVSGLVTVATNLTTAATTTAAWAGDLTASAIVANNLGVYL